MANAQSILKFSNYGLNTVSAIVNALGAAFLTVGLIIEASENKKSADIKMAMLSVAIGFYLGLVAAILGFVGMCKNAHKWILLSQIVVNALALICLLVSLAYASDENYLGLHSLAYLIPIPFSAAYNYLVNWDNDAAKDAAKDVAKDAAKNSAKNAAQ
eukprot:898648_1